jgi:hypothetical protein
MPSYEFLDSEPDSQVDDTTEESNEEEFDEEAKDRPDLDVDEDFVDPEEGDGLGPSYTQQLGYEDD